MAKAQAPLGNPYRRGGIITFAETPRSKNTCFVDAETLPLIGCICNAEGLPIREGFMDKGAGIPLAGRLGNWTSAQNLTECSSMLTVVASTSF
jgi:hypothetical protein